MATATLVGINPLGQIQKARDAIRRDNLRGVANALEAYYVTNLSYPSTGGVSWSEGKCADHPEWGWVKKPDYSGANAYIPNLAPSEIKTLPGDSNVNGINGRCYLYISDGTWYVIADHMGAEAPYNPNDPMIRLIAPACTVTQPSFTIRNDGTRCW